MALKINRLFPFIIGLILSWENSSLAAGRQKVDILALCSSADLIVAGRVDSIKNTEEKLRKNIFGREFEFGLWQATLKMRRVIKGRCSGDIIVVNFPGTKINQGGDMGELGSFERLNAGEMVVIFLRKKVLHAEYYELAHDYMSVIRIIDCPSVTHLLEAKPLQGTPEQQIASLLEASLAVFSRFEIEQALSEISDLLGQPAGTAINRLLDRTKDPAVGGVALTALFRLGDYSRLAEGVEFLQGAPESDQAVVHAKALLSNQMGYVTNTELIAKNYIPLLQHTNDFIRQNAIYAFRKARLHMAVPYLIKGLQDSNQDIRYQCLMGLSETLRRTAGWATSKGEFMNNEREYIGRWQAWWESSGRNEFMAPTEPKN